MKKILLALSIVLSIQAQSQITITSADMPVLGDTLRYSSALIDVSVLSNYQRSGANQTWDFSALRPIGQSVSRFVSSSQTQYNTVPTDRLGLLFADTLSLGSSSVNDVYNFINSSTTDFSIDYRTASIPTGVPFFPTFKMERSYQDKDEVFQFPLDYLDRDSSTFNFVFSNAFPALYYGSSGYRINDVDGWGTITTPYGTFDVLRVVTDLVSLDTVNGSGQNIGVPSHLREYQWIAKGEKIPVMRVNGVVFSGTFIPNAVEFRGVKPPEVSIRVENDSAITNTDFVIYNTSKFGTNYTWTITPGQQSDFQYQMGSSSTSKDSIVVRFLKSGFFSISLEAFDGQEAKKSNNPNAVYVQYPVGINESSSTLDKKVSLIPNITQQDRIVTLSADRTIQLQRFEVYDVSGRLLKSSDVLNTKTVSIKAPPVSGMYIIRILTDKGITTKNLVVE